MQIKKSTVSLQQKDTMNSDTYQHKQVNGGSHSAGEEMETGKDSSNVSHKRTFLMMAGSLLALLFWIAMAGHSGGGAGGGQYVTASADDKTQEGGGALAAEYQGESAKSGVFTKDIFSLGSEISPNDKCGPYCEGLVAKVAADPRGIPWCTDSLFNTINGIDYCFAPCNIKKNHCDNGSLSRMDLTSVITMYTGSGGGCVTEYCGTGYGGAYGWGFTDVCPSNGKWDYSAYLCQKCPKVQVPAPTDYHNYCNQGYSYHGSDGKEYCWSTSSIASGDRSCSKRKGFWRLGSWKLFPCVGEVFNVRTTLCQKS
mmetsp:Transcript_54694/g.61939  ORF Transcript_54694/g.61939 Transcript_54694/m.61939 type:complete len:311 (+) Transcript_54694:183-1115(+)